MQLQMAGSMGCRMSWHNRDRHLVIEQSAINFDGDASHIHQRCQSLSTLYNRVWFTIDLVRESDSTSIGHALIVDVEGRCRIIELKQFNEQVVGCRNHHIAPAVLLPESFR